MLHQVHVEYENTREWACLVEILNEQQLHCYVAR